MSNQQVNKVDLSLDDIIKLNKKAKQQQNRGGKNRSQGNGRARGQGLRGRKNAGTRGGGGGGVSPLLKKKAAMAGGGARGQAAGRRGQRGNLRGRVRNRGSANRGGSSSSSRGGSVAGNPNRGYNTTSTRGFRTGGLRGIRRGARGNFRGALRGRGNAMNQGNLQRVGPQGQGQGQGGINRVSLKQKRQLAMQALRQARKTIAQLDQQTARQNLVNARRGIPQQNPRPLSKKQQGVYSSNLSLVSSSSMSSASSGRQLQGTQVTAFSTSTSPQNARNKRRRWRAKSQTPDLHNAASTLTISIDNPPPVQSAPPQVSNPPAQAPRRQRRRPWRRQNSNSSFESIDMNRGATPSFAQQLAKLKPTTTTTYVFQKKAFSTGNTSCSLNDRFSGNTSEDPMGRKVFM